MLKFAVGNSISNCIQPICEEPYAACMELSVTGAPNGSGTGVMPGMPGPIA